MKLRDLFSGYTADQKRNILLRHFVYAAVIGALVLFGCPFLRILHIPCPCCGVTRAWLTTVDIKDSTTLLLISIFLGSLGIDRFMLGDTGMGILKLLTCGVCGILTIIDWFTVQKRTRELNYNNIMMIL